MAGWLSYSGAYACAFGAAALCYMAAFYELMTGYGYGIAGFILLAVIIPVSVAFVVFGFSYYAFSKRRFGLAGWAQGLSMLAVATAACFALGFTGALDGPLLFIFLVVTTYLGGWMMVRRGTNA